MNITYFVLLFGLIYFIENAACQVAGDCSRLEDLYVREDIPDTYLQTGKFYQFTLNHPEWSTGYFTWASRRDSKNDMLTFVEYENSQWYSQGNDWYNDTLWAFTKSEKENWYFLVNCRFPDLYLTTSNGECTETTQEKSLVINNNRDIADLYYLWRPVFDWETNLYALVPYSVPEFWYVGQSESVYKWKSYLMKLQSRNQLTKSEKAKYLFQMTAQ